MAAINQTRGTAGIVLCLFTAAAFVSVFARWEQLLQHPPEVNIEHFTALGDHAWYVITSDEDLHEPRLIFPQQPRGIFRRDKSPVTHDETQMLRIAVEQSGRWNVYSEDSLEKSAAAQPRYYLKCGENKFIEFGERNHWPAFAPEK